MRKFEYLNVPLRVWEVDYNKLGGEGWLLVQLYYDHAWLVREVEPEITTKDLLRGAYEEEPKTEHPTGDVNMTVKEGKFLVWDQAHHEALHTGARNDDCPYCKKEAMREAVQRANYKKVRGRA